MKQLLDILPELTTHFPAIEVLYLFGSHAAGRPGKDSDVDLAVYLSEKELNDNPLLELEIGLFVEKKLQSPVDIVVMQRVSPILQHQIIASGRRLFERNPERRAQFETIIFKRYIDARHYQKRRQEVYADG